MCVYERLLLCEQQKEFVHGDLGRTQPNLSSILGAPTDILQLDVTWLYDDYRSDHIPRTLLVCDRKTENSHAYSLDDDADKGFDVTKMTEPSTGKDDDDGIKIVVYTTNYYSAKYDVVERPL